MTTAESRHRLAITTIVVVNWCLLLTVPVIWDSVSDLNLPSSIFIGLSAGFAIAQLNLIGVWSALTPGRIVVRVPWSIVLLTLLWLALILGNRAAGNQANRLNEAAGILAFMLLTGFVATQIPLWLVRRFTGQRLARHVHQSEVQDQQFSINELLVGTAVLAGVLGLARAIAPEQIDFQEVIRNRELPAITAILACCNLVLVVPCVWGAFLPERSFRISAAAWSIVILAVSIVEVGVLFTVVGPAPNSQEAFYLGLAIASINYSQCLTVWAVMIALRYLGYRLEKAGHVLPSPFAPHRK